MHDIPNHRTCIGQVLWWKDDRLQFLEHVLRKTLICSNISRTTLGDSAKIHNRACFDVEDTCVAAAMARFYLGELSHVD